MNLAGVRVPFEFDRPVLVNRLATVLQATQRGSHIVMFSRPQAPNLGDFLRGVAD